MLKTPCRTIMEDIQVVSHWWHLVMLFTGASGIKHTKARLLSSANMSFSRMNQSSAYFRQLDTFKREENSPKSLFSIDCLLPTVKHWGGSFVVWGAISYRRFGLLVTLHEKVTAIHAADILGGSEGFFPDFISRWMATLWRRRDSYPDC